MCYPPMCVPSPSPPTRVFPPPYVFRLPPPKTCAPPPPVCTPLTHVCNPPPVCTPLTQVCPLPPCAYLSYTRVCLTCMCTSLTHVCTSPACSAWAQSSQSFCESWSCCGQPGPSSPESPAFCVCVCIALRFACECALLCVFSRESKCRVLDSQANSPCRPPA